MLRDKQLALPSASKAPVQGSDATHRWLLFLFVAQVPFVFLMAQSIVFARIAALVPLAIGLFGLGNSKRPALLLYSVAYIAGADVLYRMTHGGWFWEHTKYALVFLLILGLIKFQKFRTPHWPIVVYFILLLPSAIFLVLESGDFSWNSEARDQISFHLSGPLALTICVLFCSVISVTKNEFKNILASLIMPIVGTGLLVLTKMGSLQDISFGSHSMFSTSGGFGPNQVSTILGLGAALSFLQATLFFEKGWEKYFYSFLGIWLMTQAILTFSRGGVFCAFLAILLGIAIQLTNRKLRGVVMSVGVSLMLASYIILPKIEVMTEGAFQERFVDTNTTGRWQLLMADLTAWEENFFLGVGPGQSNDYHDDILGKKITAHTEYSRLVAEHGLLGMIAALVLFFTLWKNFFHSQSVHAKSLVLVLGMWAASTMLHSSMRIAVISFAFGLTSLVVRQKKQTRR